MQVTREFNGIPRKINVLFEKDLNVINFPENLPWIKGDENFDIPLGCFVGLVDYKLVCSY